MRRLSQILVMVAVLISAIALVPPLGAAPAEAATTTLAGLTTITADGASSALVSLPRAAHVAGPLNDNPDVTIEGAGRYIGVALVEETTDRYGAFLLTGRLAADAICDETGCPYGVATPSIAGGGVSGSNGQWQIPPGEYRLHVIAEPDSGPIKITLQLHGLDGQTTITPADETGLHTQPLPPSVPMPQSQSLYWSGARHDMGEQQRGLMWSMVWLRHPLDPVGDYHYCPYRATDPGDHPGCPGTLQELEIQSTLVGGVKAWVLLEGFAALAQGDFAQKVWFAGNRIDGVDGLALWLPFGEVTDQLQGSGYVMRATVYPVVAIGEDAAAKTLTQRASTCFVSACGTSTGLLEAGS